MWGIFATRPQPESLDIQVIFWGLKAAKRTIFFQPHALRMSKDPQDWVVANYSSSTCDLWEEVRSEDFFWNRYTMRSSPRKPRKCWDSHPTCEDVNCWGCHDATFLEHPRLEGSPFLGLNYLDSIQKQGMIVEVSLSNRHRPDWEDLTTTTASQDAQSISKYLEVILGCPRVS